jgi:alpha-glucosidase
VAVEAGVAREVRSPDGKIGITIHTDAPLGYSITVDGKVVLARSRLGLELADKVSLGEHPVLRGEERKSSDTHWENPFGKNRDVRDHYNELDLTLKEGDRAFGVVARAYDDGVAFRLVLPRQPSMDSFVVTRDATEFTFAEDRQVWAGWNNEEGPSRPEGGFIGSQEWQYRPNKLSALNPNFKYGLPFLVQTPAAYVAITESDLLDWSAMWLVPKAGAEFTLETQLAPPIPARPWPSRRPSATNAAAVSTAPAPVGEVQKGLVEARTPHHSPWRTFIIGRQPCDLIQSDLVFNLATPSKLADVSWVKPGMSSWGTWWPKMGRNDLPTLKQFIQLAANMGWPYQLS